MSHGAITIDGQSIQAMRFPAQHACGMCGEDPFKEVLFEGVAVPLWVKYAIEMIRLRAMVEAARNLGIPLI